MRVGEVAVEREVVDGFVWSAKPVRVVAEGPLAALYRAVGTRCFWPSHPRGEHRRPSTVVQRPESWGDGRFGGLLTLVDFTEPYVLTATVPSFTSAAERWLSTSPTPASEQLDLGTWIGA